MRVHRQTFVPDTFEGHTDVEEDGCVCRFLLKASDNLVIMRTSCSVFECSLRSSLRMKLSSSEAMRVFRSRSNTFDIIGSKEIR